MLSGALKIAKHVDWRRIAPTPDPYRQLMRSAFYAFFLHEQFHHKVESLGFRILVTRGRDSYMRYKTCVYRPNYLTPRCLEESLANADSLRRLGERRYKDRIDQPIRAGLRAHLIASMKTQAPGYAEGLNFLTDREYQRGVSDLQSQVLDGALGPTRPAADWKIAPQMWARCAPAMRCSAT